MSAVGAGPYRVRRTGGLLLVLAGVVGAALGAGLMAAPVGALSGVASDAAGAAVLGVSAVELYAGWSLYRASGRLAALESHPRRE